MTQPHKILQHIYHATTPEFIDIIESGNLSVYYKSIETDDELITEIVDYFNTDVDVIPYPAKSYVVGIIYAHYLTQYFDIAFLDALSDPTLLHGNDKHFVPYTEDAHIYDAVLKQVNLFRDINRTKQCRATIQFFMEEFMIDKPEYYYVTHTV